MRDTRYERSRTSPVRRLGRGKEPGNPITWPATLLREMERTQEGLLEIFPALVNGLRVEYLPG